MLERAKLKDFVYARHKEDQSENKAREQKRPTAIEIVCFWRIHLVGTLNVIWTRVDAAVVAVRLNRTILFARSVTK